MKILFQYILLVAGPLASVQCASNHKTSDEIKALKVENRKVKDETEALKVESREVKDEIEALKVENREVKDEIGRYTLLEEDFLKFCDKSLYREFVISDHVFVISTLISKSSIFDKGEKGEKKAFTESEVPFEVVWKAIGEEREGRIHLQQHLEVEEGAANDGEAESTLTPNPSGEIDDEPSEL